MIQACEHFWMSLYCGWRNLWNFWFSRLLDLNAQQNFVLCPLLYQNQLSLNLRLERARNFSAYKSEEGLWIISRPTPPLLTTRTSLRIEGLLPSYSFLFPTYFFIQIFRHISFIFLHIFPYFYVFLQHLGPKGGGDRFQKGGGDSRISYLPQG